MPHLDPITGMLRIDPVTGAPLIQSPYPALARARGEWHVARKRLDALCPTTEERAALTPPLRREAVLKVLDPMSTELHILIVVPIGALLLGMPYLLALLGGAALTIGNLALLYVLYLPCLVVSIVAAFAGVSGLVILGEDRPRWFQYAIALSAASAVTIGMATFWLYLDNQATFLLSLFSALLVVLVTIVIFLADIPFAEARKRRQLGMLGVDHIAALLLLEEWETLVAHRRRWRTPTGRRELSKALARLAHSASTRLERCVRANGGRTADRRWAADLAWHLGRTITEHRSRLLRMDLHPQYAELLAEVREQTVMLCRGDWSTIDGGIDTQGRPSLLRRLGRFGVPVVLLGMAVGIGYLPGFALPPDTLFTVRLSLVVPAVLSLLPIRPASQESLASAMRDALGFMR
ncbi:hypothetical protein GCM10027290_64700 [Micromonospora sonneratiae]|uniref:Fusaric acid resistance protein-like n=1 Tax=Micromonospora sonneratiae TaxID=1184706 RepID=A0ABW3Y8B8_9ACTN